MLARPATICAIVIGLFQAATPNPTTAQSADVAAEFLRTYEEQWHGSWDRDSDPAQFQRLGDTLLTTEPQIKNWPLSISRDQFKALVLDALCEIALAFDRRADADNIVKHCTAAILQRKGRELPDRDWMPRLYHSLGDAYRAIQGDDRPDSLEKAIKAFNRALRFNIRRVDPERWAWIQIGLGHAHLDRTRGIRERNIEKALSHYRAALQVVRENETPDWWAKVQTYLSEAYAQRMRGSPVQNLERSKVHYTQALRVYESVGGSEAISLGEELLKTERNLRRWPLSLSRDEVKATVLDKLCFSYYDEAANRSSAPVNRVIERCESALSIPSKTANGRARRVGALHSCLGWALLQENKEGPPPDIERSIKHLEAALQHGEGHETSNRLAQVHWDLAVAYTNRKDGERAGNVARASRHYAEALTTFTEQTHPQEWALLQLSLAHLYYDLREQQNLLEKSITHYESALTVLTRDSNREEWAIANHALAFLFGDRAAGERNENLGKGIAHYKLALTVYTKEDDPGRWSRGQFNIGQAYLSMSKGESTANAREAVSHLSAAAKVISRAKRPKFWVRAKTRLAVAYFAAEDPQTDNEREAMLAFEEARTLFLQRGSPADWTWSSKEVDIGNAYLYRKAGQRGDNFQKAMLHYQAALAGPMSEDVAEAHWLLCGLLTNEPRGERATNIEQAISHCERAMTVFKKETVAERWADAQATLGWAYEQRVRGDRQDNLKRAIGSYESALSVFTRDRFPERWASLQNNLGLAYWDRLRWERAERGEWDRIRDQRRYNRDRAIGHYEAALTVVRAEEQPMGWARLQGNLGLAYWDRVGGERGENIEKAIAHLEAALERMSPLSIPEEWARLKAYLALSYQNRIAGARADNLKTAIRLFEESLGVLTRDSYPRDHMRAARRLGAALIEQQDWDKALEAYLSARDAFLLQFGEGISEDQARFAIEEAGPLFAEAAYVASERGDNDAAFALATEGRARLLALATRLSSLELPAAMRSRLDDLRSKIRDERAALDNKRGRERAEGIDKVKALQGELLALVKEARATPDSGGSAIERARAIVGEGDAIVLPVVTKVGSKLFVVTAAQGLTVTEVPELTLNALNVFVRGDRRDGELGGWLGAYQNSYRQIDLFEQLMRHGRDPAKRAELYGEIRLTIKTWHEAIDRLRHTLWTVIGRALTEVLERAGTKAGGRVLWLPTGALGLFPIGLAQHPRTGDHLSDRYEISYSPSLDVLPAAGRRAPPAEEASLAFLSGPLRMAPVEAAIVGSHFPSDRVRLLTGRDARVENVLSALKNTSYWHFATHGKFHWDAPYKSSLDLGRNSKLTIEQILGASRLNPPRLVVLSACETGLHEIDRTPDEFLGLPGAFLSIGASGVIGTLWPVSDVATAVLIPKFYELHRHDGLSPSAALRQAKIWLRDATRAELLAYAKSRAALGQLPAEMAHEFTTLLSLVDAGRAKLPERAKQTALLEKQRPVVDANSLSERPFQHPYYWGGFVYTGL